MVILKITLDNIDAEMQNFIDKYGDERSIIWFKNRLFEIYLDNTSTEIDKVIALATIIEFNKNYCKLS